MGRASPAGADRRVRPARQQAGQRAAQQETEPTIRATRRSRWRRKPKAPRRTASRAEARLDRPTRATIFRGRRDGRRRHGRGAAVDRREPLDATIAGMPDLGAFVSLKRAGQLRSCCGFLGQAVALCEAFDTRPSARPHDDPRFPPISPTELEHLDMEVWLLWGMRPVEARGEDRIEAVEIGRHGLADPARRGPRAVAARRGHRTQPRRRGLPAADVSQGPAAARRLERRRDAGEHVRGLRDPRAAPKSVDRSRRTSDAAARRADDRATRRAGRLLPANLLAMVQGATPSFYLPGAFDGNVNGLLLAATGRRRADVSGNRLSIKPGDAVAVDALLLVQALANMLRAPGVGPTRWPPRDRLSVLWDPAMHGTADRARPGRRRPAPPGLVVMTPIRLGLRPTTRACGRRALAEAAAWPT